LDKEPSKTYSGPYQSKEDIFPEILDDLIQFEGLNLAQVQSQFTELSQHVKEWGVLANRFDEFLSEIKSHTKALTDLADKLGKVIQLGMKPEEPVIARNIPISQAIKEISKLFTENSEMYYSDIAEALNLDFGVVIKACKMLEKDGIIEEVRSESKRIKKTRL
jgi:hypothetical protein